MTATPYGEVDAAELAATESGYDTTRILSAVRKLNETRTNLCEPEGLRDYLFFLHSIAHTLVNGAGLTVSALDEPLVDQTRT
ncbi:hypothetical protein GNZ12_38955 [Paraburkholderia sp. 1N]|uniref:Uncharacterized protein n=1 Tax=Paraburkholderia solitsugae TaxID=2675748 RepID=A0ABX2C3L4_9BURK|nr:hypothetical protein [Paraburkholderia solitsugae]NPT47171.1 hypothetical protein [Paraburkholderia solitsugae]